MGDAEGHWNSAYVAGDSGVSWFQNEASSSLTAVEAVSAEGDSVIDIGGGSSPLVDGLLERGHRNVAVLDIADAGLSISRERLGARADEVDWIVANLLDWTAPREFDIWHDRAVLHFLTADDERAQYLEVLKSTLRVGGCAVIGVFAEDGPTKCSGLEVCRYSPAELETFLGTDFETVSSARELHVTPGGNEQAFTWITSRRVV